jgi:hypothetical protein
MAQANEVLRYIYSDPGNRTDCNKFLKAAGRSFHFLVPDGNADAIITYLGKNSGGSNTLWRAIPPTKDASATDAAFQCARVGKLVVVGASHQELGSGHGHVAILLPARSGPPHHAPLVYGGALPGGVPSNGTKSIREVFPVHKLYGILHYFVSHTARLGAYDHADHAVLRSFLKDWATISSEVDLLARHPSTSTLAASARHNLRVHVERLADTFARQRTQFIASFNSEPDGHSKDVDSIRALSTHIRTTFVGTEPMYVRENMTRELVDALHEFEGQGMDLHSALDAPKQPLITLPGKPAAASANWLIALAITLDMLKRGLIDRRFRK